MHMNVTSERIVERNFVLVVIFGVLNVASLP